MKFKTSSSSSSSSSSYICHAVWPPVDPFRSHVSRSPFKGLPWFLLPVPEWHFITLGILVRGILFTCCIQLLSVFFPWDLQLVKISSEQSQRSPAVGLLPLASGPACLVMAFPPFLVKQLYRCDSVVISSFVRPGYTTRRWRWLVGRIGYSITVR